jgi:hypothetical protein
LARLELRWREHPKHASKSTGRRDYLDFVVDGEPIDELLNAHDRVAILGGWFPNSLFEAIYFRGLLLEHPAYLETGRYELYVCPLCGDVGCGSITAEIEAIDDQVVWRDFAYEIDYWFDDPSEILHRDAYEHIGPFKFDRTQYRDALLAWPLRTRTEGIRNGST